MLQSFYKYIVEDLIIGYFREYPLKRGDRYYIIIENDEYREGLLAAIKELSTPITITNIYEGSNTPVDEEPYYTCYLKATQEQPGIIIGYDKTATEDYLTTMRNQVGCLGKKYEDFGILYILSDRGLSSIITASLNLQGENAPLHSNVIIENITQKAEGKITKDFELMYLRKYLDQIAASINDGTCDLFDFQPALSILQKGDLKGHFGDINFFSDDSIYEASFTKTDAEMKEDGIADILKFGIAFSGKKVSVKIK